MLSNAPAMGHDSQQGSVVNMDTYVAIESTRMQTLLMALLVPHSQARGPFYSHN